MLALGDDAYGKWGSESPCGAEQGPAGRGLDSIPFGPCGNIAEPGDFTSAMRQNIQGLQGAL